MRPYKHLAADQLTLERIFHALSDPIRLEIVRHLARVEMATCGELDGGRPKSSMSHHFRILRDAGLLHTRAEGTIHQNTLRLADLNARFPGLLDAILAQPTESGTHPAKRKR
ncbi:ArsR family transcriptional regulator [Dyella sp. M7H15-1]|nr:ArsR family transcriptional regulator [Dyella sp. M7H15-1]